jgi:hypothetical protein
MLNIKEISFPYCASSNYFLVASFSSSLPLSFFCFFNSAALRKGPWPPQQFASRYPYLASSVLLYSTATRRPLMFSFHPSRGLPTGLLPWNIPSSTFFDTLELSVQANL